MKLRKIRQIFIIFLTALSLVCTALMGITFMKQPTTAKAETASEAAEPQRKTPLMGWASWNIYSNDINEDRIYSQAQQLVNLGLADLGYTYVNTDDGWQMGRNKETGYVNVHPDRFPSGMKGLADKIHALGLKAGIYTDAGELSCSNRQGTAETDIDVGLYGHDREDLYKYLVDWGFDFIKVDWCGGTTLGLDSVAPPSA